MGKYLKVISDPTKDKGHEAGAVVEFQQPSETSLGSVLITRQMHWEHHADAVQEAFKGLDYYQNKILETRPDDGNYRHIRNHRLIKKLYIYGSDLVNHNYLLYRHMPHWIISTVHVWPNNTAIDKQAMSHYESRTLDFEEPLNYVVKDVIKRSDLFKHPGYTYITGEWKNVRHALNHPTHDNIYNAKDGDWDKVPIAWFASGKFREQFHQIVDFHNQLMEEWLKILPNYKRPGKITIDKVGATSKYIPQIKRPKKKKN